MRAEKTTALFVSQLEYSLTNQQDYTQDSDKLLLLSFPTSFSSWEWVRLNKTFTDTLNTHQYPKAVQDLLGEMMK